MSNNRRNFDIAIGSALLFVTGTVTAMTLYPGGTLQDSQTDGYRFFENFFSDLGMTESYAGISNIPSAILFFIALSGAGGGILLFFHSMSRLFPHGVGKWLAKTGSLCGVIAGVGFIGVAFTPANIAPFPHFIFVQVAFVAFFITASLYAPAIFLHQQYPNWYGVGMAIFALALGSYVWLLFKGPGISSPTGLFIQVARQKAIVYASILVTLFQAIGAKRMISEAIFIAS